MGCRLLRLRTRRSAQDYESAQTKRVSESNVNNNNATSSRRCCFHLRPPAEGKTPHVYISRGKSYPHTTGNDANWALLHGSRRDSALRNRPFHELDSTMLGTRGLWYYPRPTRNCGPSPQAC